MKFTDLQFKSLPSHFGEDGIQALQFFENNYGVSVVRHVGSYGYSEGLYEVAVLKGSVDDYELCYDTPITDDVMGHRDEQDIENIIEEVKSL